MLDERHTALADRRWISEAQARYGTALYPHRVTCFELGGISNRPCWRTVKLRAKEGPRSLVNEAIKACMVDTIGLRRFYRALYGRKYVRESSPSPFKP